MKRNRSSLMYGTLVLTGTSIASQLVGFVYRIFLSRMIGAENMGLYQLILPVYAVVMSVVSVGLTASVSRLSAEYHALGNTKAIHQLLRQCQVFLCALFAVIAAVIISFFDPISVYLLGDARTQFALLLLLPCMLLTGIENLYKYYYYGTSNIRPPAIMELLEQVIRTVAVITLLVIFLPQTDEITVGLIVIGMTICELISAFGLMRLYRRQLRGNYLRGNGVSPAILREKISDIAIPLGATSLLGNLMSSANCILIPQRLILSGVPVSDAMSAFGVLFGMAIPLMMLPGAFIGALSLTLLPRLAESHALHRKEDIKQIISKAILVTSVLVLPAMALLVIFGSALGTGMFHEPTVGNYIAPMAPGVFFAFLQVVTACALNGIGKQRPVAVISIISDVIHLGFTYFCTAIPGVGMNGFIAGFIISSAVGLVLNMMCLVRATGIQVELVNWIAVPGIASLAMGICTHFLFRMCMVSNMRGPISILISALMGGALYLLLLRFQGVRIGAPLLRPKSKK